MIKENAKVWFSCPGQVFGLVLHVTQLLCVLLCTVPTPILELTLRHIIMTDGVTLGGIFLSTFIDAVRFFFPFKQYFTYYIYSKSCNMLVI